MSDPATTEPSELQERVARLEAELAAARRRPRRDWDAYAAALASLIGLLALVVGGYTAHLQRQQIRAAVWPRLAFPSSNLTRKLLAVNHGVGPARVTAIRVQVGGKTVRTWGEVIQAFGHADRGYNYSTFDGRVLPAGAEAELFTAHDNPESHRMFDDFLANRRGFGMLVCYCSVLDECWLAGRGALSGPVDGDRPIDRCPIARDERFRT